MVHVMRVAAAWRQTAAVSKQAGSRVVSDDCSREVGSVVAAEWHQGGSQAGAGWQHEWQQAGKEVDTGWQHDCCIMASRV